MQICIQIDSQKNEKMMANQLRSAKMIYDAYDVLNAEQGAKFYSLLKEKYRHREVW